ncbi:MAG: sugar phosphate isomerase/epimerase family protein [Gammaproteobacteria bacterium]|jgi:sugar phosphate isomerase/epimerase|nr:sugar phosphate isomerase/epimerase family protein [Gammaproteobacteria bacterium]
MKTVACHIHSYSLHNHFIHLPEYDVFRFIDHARELGFTGVNISANGPGYRNLGGTTGQHFAKVKQYLQAHNMACELDTSDTSVGHMTGLLHVAQAIGADTLRVYTRYQGKISEVMQWTIRDLQALAPVAEDLSVQIVLENHEDFTGSQIATILDTVDSPWVKALYDYGNSQNVAEDPLSALQAMAPHITRIHMKDHIVIKHADKYWTQGVAIGKGTLPFAELTRRLLAQGLTRLCFENSWGYVAPISDTHGPLPKSTCFTVFAQAPMVALQLPPDQAVAGEAQALVDGIEYLRQVCAHLGYQVLA